MPEFLTLAMPAAALQRLYPPVQRKVHRVRDKKSYVWSEEHCFFDIYKAKRIHR